MIDADDLSDAPEDEGWETEVEIDLGADEIEVEDR